MTTMQEHADWLQDSSHWAQVTVPTQEAEHGEVVKLAQCPWCAAIVLPTPTALWQHGQWHVRHMQAHDHDEDVPEGPRHPMEG